MFSICKQTHPATGVEHAIACHFFNKSEKSLITAGANVIKVFRLIPDIDKKSRLDKYTGPSFHYPSTFIILHVPSRIQSPKIKARMCCPVHGFWEYYVYTVCEFG